MPHRSVLARQVLPSVAAYVALVLAAVLADRLLHAAGLAGVGRVLGPVGTGLIIASFAYSLRKRKLLRLGSPKALLELHEVLGWVGALAILVHAGVHVHALIPWLAVGAMLVVVASGFVGKLLLRRAGDALRAREEEGGRERDPAAERRRVLDAATVDVMKRWRAVHMPLNAAFVVLALVHVVAALMLWR